MRKEDKTPVEFIETNSTKLSGVQSEHSGAFIHMHDEGDSDADDVLYIGKDRITDKLNIGDRDVNTVTNKLGGLGSSTIGKLRKKTVSDIILDMVTGSEPFGGIQVVDSQDDLTNGTIENPYQGMVVVSIDGKPALWILKGDDSTKIENWSQITGTDDEILERLGLAESDIDDIKNELGNVQGEVVSIASDVNDIKENISTIEASIENLNSGLNDLSDTVGHRDDEESTGIFEELDDLNRRIKGASLGGYTYPVMSDDMATRATEAGIGFNKETDPYIVVNDDYNTDDDNPDIFYKGIVQDMYKSIIALQQEVTRLRNSFEFGIVSYKDDDTAWGKHGRKNPEVEEEEPLWAVEPGYLTLVEDNPNFITFLDANNKFKKNALDVDGFIDISVPDQLTFDNCSATFFDGLEPTATKDELTLYNIGDSKLITYLVSNKPDIKINLISIDDDNNTRQVDVASLLGDIRTKKYGICIIISRKQKSDDDTYKGFNYVYFSIIDYNTNQKLCEGYLDKNNDILSDTRVLQDNRYSIHSLDFNRLTLYRMKFYTKYEDFSSGWEEREDEIISNPPSEYKTTYEVAHIAIRSVKNTEVLETITDELLDNELIWNKERNALYIKSNGKIYRIGSNSGDDDEHNKDKYMTNKDIIEALSKMGIIINNPTYKEDEDGELTVLDSFDSISMAPIADVTFINEDTNKKFTFSVDPEGNLVGKDKSAQTIAEFLKEIGKSDKYKETENYKAVRGFSSDYLFLKTESTSDIFLTDDAGKLSDRLRISSFYAPISTDTLHGCTHSFVELENSSEVDIPLTGVYLHFYNPGAIYNPSTNTYSGKVYHLALDGVIPAGGTYLIRGAKHAEFDDESAFIKVKNYDKEWYEDGNLVSFEQIKVDVSGSGDSEQPTPDSPIKTAYRFCLTYGIPNLDATYRLVMANNSNGSVINNVTYDFATYPNLIVDPRFIDSCSFSTASSVCKETSNNPWYVNGKGGVGIQITPNTMFRLMFALDPAKQAFNGFNTKDSSRIRYNKKTDIQILNLDKEFIGFPHSDEIIKIDRYTPKASFEHRNVITDKSQLNREKPNMVTCSFGVDVYNTRCFNWISCGTFDEYVWIRKKGETSWENKFQSYTKVSDNTPEDHSKSIYRKEYLKDVNNTVYARMINRFPGNNVLFTAHKCVVVLPDATDTSVEYEYVVGRPDKNGNPDPEHTNNVYKFTVYPRTYEGRVYQITDQQGFHWIEYQVWAASAKYLNTKIKLEVDGWNSTHTQKVFPIIINTGDMTQSGARVNEWLDYYNGGQCLFNHLEQMNVVGNNDLCPINPRDLGTGNDEDKSSSHFFHYFYCFDVRDTEKCNEEDVSTETAPNRFIYTGEKFFTGESLIVKAHTGHFGSGDDEVNIDVKEDKYIPSLYYFRTAKVLYVMVNSEIPKTNCQLWFGLCSNNAYVNIYTGIEIKGGGEYAAENNCFTPIYETLYAWLNSNQDGENKPIRKVIVAMHEMPFTVITNESLYKGTAKNIPCTRNFPTKKGRLGSNTNQLDINEDRGIFWCSRLLEYFNCKLVIGGHKHTYALSYPIKEKYTWNGTDSETQIKPMGPNLSDEAGTNPDVLVSWDIEPTDTNKVSYNFGGDTALNSTKTPYIPKQLYNEYGKAVTDNSTDFIRCCTPISISDDGEYNGFVTYSMCQATGYKLKSNKELPAPTQVFSKIIPMTEYTQNATTKAFTDSASGEQLYPMYSILEFEYDNNGKVNGITVSMNRITNIFKSNGKDTFDQLSYGTKEMARECLCTYEKEDCNRWGTAFATEEDEIEHPDVIPPSELKDGYLYFDTIHNKVMKYVVTSTENKWEEVKNRMYGRWLKEDIAKERWNAYIADPATVSDNRYLHIKY